MFNQPVSDVINVCMKTQVFMSLLLILTFIINVPKLVN